MSFFTARVSAQIVGSETAFEISSTELKSPGLEIGKSRLDDVHAEAFEQLGDFNFFGGVQLAAGDLLAVAERGVENVQSLTHTNLFIE